MRIKVAIWFLCFLTSGHAFSQQITYKNMLGVSVLPGFLYAHTEDAENLQAHTLGVEFQYARWSLNNRHWADGYKAPGVGVNAMFMNLGNQQLTGKVFAIIPNFQTSFRVRENSRFGIRLGTGLGYLTRSFDRFENRRNIAIGSHLNGALQVLFVYNVKTGSGWLNTGIGITHFSNASFHVPNLGVNMPGLFLGYQFASKTKTRTPLLADTMLDMPWTVNASMAFNERSLANPHNFIIGHIGLVKRKRLNTARSWRWGGDLFFDKTHQFMDYPDASLKGLTPKQMTEVGVRAGYEWRIAKLDLCTDVGVYVYKPSKNKAFTYQVIGLNYHLTQKLFVQSALKIHFGTADFFEWGVGYKFSKWKK